MKELLILSELKELSKDLLAKNDDIAESYNTCWLSLTKLIKAIKQDIDELFNNVCFITNARFILEDSTYRQGANICRLEIRFVKDEQLSLIAECLIDHGRVFLTLKEMPQSKEFEFIADLIKRNYNSEFVADMRQMKQKQR